MDQQYYIRTRGRILGPYDVEKLQGLAKRGQLSRMHEVSADGVTWVKASTYPELFQSGSLPANPVTAAVAPIKTVASSVEQGRWSGVPTATNGSAVAKWYYAADQGQHGPVDSESLQQLLASGQLNRETRVWSDGMAEWLPIADVGELSYLVNSHGAANPYATDVSDEAGKALVSSKPWILATTIIAFVFAALSGLGGAAFIIRGIRDNRSDMAINGLFASISAFLVAGGGILLAAFHRRIAMYSHAQSTRTMSAALYSGRTFWRYVACVTALGIAIIIVQALLVMPRTTWEVAGNGGSQEATATEPLDVGPPVAVASVQDRKVVQDSVALIVTGSKIVRADGSKAEVPFFPKADGDPESAGTGTGFVVTADGYILTNKHVVEDAANAQNAELLLKRVEEKTLIKWTPCVWVFVGDKKFEAEIKHVSDNFDMAILKIPREGGHYFNISAKEVMLNTKVVALGFPGVGRESLSEKERSAVEAEIKSSRLSKIEKIFTQNAFVVSLTPGAIGSTIQEGGGPLWIRHSATLHHGNSGGPLVDEKNGLVLGINTRGVINQSTGGLAEAMYMSLALEQVRDEINKVVPDASWK